MKLEQVEFESDVFGAEKEMDFSIDTESSVIFDILRDKMYTDKIAAVCREVSSNSRDANVEAGRGDVPIKISIVEPFELECISDKSIIFQDNGLGITPDRMADVFVKYASSTKRDTNEQVGGFGLGAKTPFAYSDTFTVITVCDIPEIVGSCQEIELGGKVKRVKFIYTAMIDDSAKGKMILFESEVVPNEEPTGTQIVVPFNDRDKLKFEKEVHRFTSLWEVKPELSGFDYNYSSIEKVATYDGLFDILKDEERFFYAEFLVSIDGIPYKLDENLFSDKFGDFIKEGISDYHPILMPFKTGELGISANREGIHYTEKTIMRIEERLSKIVAKFEADMEEYITKDASYIESCIRLNEVKKSR